MLIVRRGAAIAGVGIAIGLVVSLLLTRVLASMLNDVTPTDPAVFLGNAALVLAVSMAACYLPARWAGRVDPAVVLRND
jgi:ABC-type antimicrobial peptide transport system permease subunit